MRLGGYSEVARELTRYYRLDPPMKRQQIEAWNKRRVMNQAGRMFPSPVRNRGRLAIARRPRLEFDIDEVIRWTRAGVPGDRGHGWRDLAASRAQPE